MVGDEELKLSNKAVRSAGNGDWQAFPECIRLELTMAAVPDGRRREDVAEPFVPLGVRGRFSRTLAARVVGGRGETICDVALRLQSDDYPAARLPGWTNEDVERQWAAQYDLVCAASAAGAVPAVVDVFPAAGDGGALCLPPTLYCKARTAFFAAPCPLCGGRLQVCRDSALLEAKGLPRHDASLERFLFCPQCVAEAGHRFYALLLSDPQLRSRAPVAEQTDLYVALGGLARRGGPLPCHGCERVPSCHPESGEGDATRLLTSLSFYDFHCFASERYDLHYDEFVRLLGGGAGVAKRAPAGRQSLFESDPDDRLPLEVLRLKLAALTQLVVAVRQTHASTKRPHLAVAPENIVVRLSAPAPALPALYRFDVRLLAVGTAVPRRFQGAPADDLAAPMLTAPPLRDGAFASPLLSQAEVAYEGSLRILGVGEAGSELLEVELTANTFDLGSLGPMDAVHVKVRQGRPIPLNFEFVANGTTTAAGAIRLRCAAPLANPAQRRSLATLVGEAPLAATFLVYPVLHVPCDLDSLGTLVFSTLAANQSNGAPRLARAARGLSNSVLAFVDEHPRATAEEVADFAADCVAHGENDGWLAVRNLYDDPARFPAAASARVEPYWRAALVLGLRALTRTPGFGFCRAHDDFDAAHPEGPADHFLGELEILQRKVEDELLQIQGRRREMSEAIRRVREELRARVRR